MSYDILNTLQISPTYLIKWTIVAIIVVIILTPVVLKVRKVVEYYRQRQNQTDRRTKLVEANASDIIEIKECMLGFKEVLIELMHDRISRKCKTYIRLGYIPDDEYGDFTRKWKLYHDILKGNHGLEKRYEKAIVLPLESEYKLYQKEN